MTKRKKSKDAVANRAEILQFLTGLLRGDLMENEKGVRERLKAAELLGKGCGAFEVEATETAEFKVEIEVMNEQAERLTLWPQETNL
jgi:hypothetical protein